MKLYKIVRGYKDDKVPSRMIKRNLSLEEAQAHCRDPETSSSTCSTREGMEHTRVHGAWFDGYEEQ